MDNVTIKEKPAKPTEPAAQTINTVADKTAETTKTMADKSAETAKTLADKTAEAARESAQTFKANVEQATQAGRQAIKETMDKSLSALNEVNAQSKRNLEALMASMTAATRGVEALSGQAMAYTKRSVEGHVEQAKALTACRSMQEMVELQTNFAKSAMEAYIAELNRASETITAAVKDSFKPLNERASAIAETVQSVR